jgi:hypothetical protein
MTLLLKRVYLDFIVDWNKNCKYLKSWHDTDNEAYNYFNFINKYRIVELPSSIYSLKRKQKLLLHSSVS